MGLDGLLYILTFGIIIYYLLSWTKITQQLKKYIRDEKTKIRANWSGYTASGPFSSAIKEGFGDLLLDKSSRANCAQWPEFQIQSNKSLAPYNDTETNTFAPMDTTILKAVDGAAVDPQLVIKRKRDKYNNILQQQSKIYLDAVNTYLAKPFTAGQNKTNLDIILAPPAYFNLTLKTLGQTPGQFIQAWINDPAITDILTPDQLREVTAKYPGDIWLRIYTQVKVFKADYSSNVNKQIMETDPAAFSKTYAQISNVDYALDKFNSADPVQGSSYYPADRKYLNAEAQRRVKLVQDLDKSVLSSEDYKAKWGWVDKIGKPLNIPAEFGINSSPDSIRDVQTRSVMDILTDYDPNQFACQRIYQECGTRQAPGFNLDAYDYNKYDSYLDLIRPKPEPPALDPENY